MSRCPRSRPISAPPPAPCSGWWTHTRSCSPACCSRPAPSVTASAARARCSSGLVVFLGAALVASTVDSAAGVVACRAFMGIGAAFVMPATLSIIVNVFPPHERARAIATWAGISGAAGAIGPLATGLLLQHFSWNSVFLINVPVILLALVAGAFIVPTSRDPKATRIDVVGALLSIVGIVGLVYAIIEAPAHG